MKDNIPGAFKKAVAQEISQQKDRVKQCQGIASGTVINCFQCRAIVGHYCSSYLQGLVDEQGIMVKERIIRTQEAIQ